MGMEPNVRKTTVHFRNSDLEVIKRLMDLTGLRLGQLIRVALRRYLERLEKH